MKVLLLTTILFLLGISAFGQEDTEEEINYKADFIIKLIDYTTWAEGAGKDSQGAVVISVIGESPLTPRLKELAAAETKNDKKITVKVVSIEDKLTDCQILFLPTKDKKDLAKILKKVDGHPVLTVSDCYYFARHGVMINFVKEENDGKTKVKFEVNRTTIKLAGLKLSSRLLKLATII